MIYSFFLLLYLHTHKLCNYLFLQVDVGQLVLNHIVLLCRELHKRHSWVHILDNKRYSHHWFSTKFCIDHWPEHNEHQRFSNTWKNIECKIRLSGRKRDSLVTRSSYTYCLRWLQPRTDPTLQGPFCLLMVSLPLVFFWMNYFI